ncbi:zincin-like metallopeptidase domain-containing protein [uncultured Tateyamaria sp.]|uniref:ArdC family protein n=1 Tax=uncultured Tateyamaria sp. TaxID=455651 RepID=UPI0026018547|nr:zincin-like metallopeptidase domain-containing protein [uncultured Tateyamaria sp.]
MARSQKPKFDASEAITNELIRIIERGVLPWRKPWTAGGSTQPLRHTGEPYQGVNNFLLTMRTMVAGYSSPYWMTMRQANEMDAKIRKGEKSALVVFYGQSRKEAAEASSSSGDETDGEAARAFRFQKSYRVFNADQIEGLPESFHPSPLPETAHPPAKPIPHIQAFFDAIDITTVFTGREAYYIPAVDKVYMPLIELFEDPRSFYGVWAHEMSHATKARHRLNRSFGHARFGNTAYAREEIVAELASCFLGQKLGFTAHTLEMNAAYLDNWLRVLRSDKTAIFQLAADAQRACDWLVEASEKGRADPIAAAA